MSHHLITEELFPAVLVRNPTAVGLLSRTKLSGDNGIVMKMGFFNNDVVYSITFSKVRRILSNRITTYLPPQHKLFAINLLMISDSTVDDEK